MDFLYTIVRRTRTSSSTRALGLRVPQRLCEVLFVILLQEANTGLAKCMRPLFVLVAIFDVVLCRPCYPSEKTEGAPTLGTKTSGYVRAST